MILGVWGFWKWIESSKNVHTKFAVAEAKVREIKQQELEARRGLDQLTSGSQLKQTSEPAVVDVYQHTRYETNEPGVAVEPAHDEEGKGLMDKIGEGIKKLF